MFPQIQQQQINGLGFDPATITATAVTLFNAAKNIFGQKVTPEQQAQKAGVWGAMLTDFLANERMTGYELGQKWVSQLPFSQNSTKTRFVAENLNNQSRDYIINHLVQKINDELSKGNMPTVTKQQLLDNFYGGSPLINERDIAPMATSSPNSGQVYQQTQSMYDPYPAQTTKAGISNNTILIVGAIAAAAAYFMFNSKSK